MQYLDLKYSLISAFMKNMPENIVDVSYSTSTIQIVMLEETVLEHELKARIVDAFGNAPLEINEVYISKEKFNENIGDWEPIYYKWLPIRLFSRAEV